MISPNLLVRWWALRQLSPSRRVLVVMHSFGLTRRSVATIATRALMRDAQVEGVLARLEHQRMVVSEWSPGGIDRRFWLAPRGQALVLETLAPPLVGGRRRYVDWS